MNRLIRGKYLVCGLLPYYSHTDDVVRDSDTVRKTDTTNVNETGMDRVKRIFKTDEFGDISPELNLIANTCCMSIFVGALYGGIMNSKGAYISFMKSNQATAFQNHLEAKKRLQDKVTLSFGRGAFKWGWRLTLFTTSYITVTTTIAAYRGKNGILEHVTAGAFSGFVYKFQEGPRAALVGTGLGIALGIFAGLCTSGLLKLTGMDMNDVRYWQYKWREGRLDYKRESIQKYLENEEILILREHNKEHREKLDKEESVK